MLDDFENKQWKPLDFRDAIEQFSNEENEISPLNFNKGSANLANIGFTNHPNINQSVNAPQNQQQQ